MDKKGGENDGFISDKGKPTATMVRGRVSVMLWPDLRQGERRMRIERCEGEYFEEIQADTAIGSAY